MAVISNVNLNIVKGTPGNQRQVTVSYVITFSTMELMAQSIFSERISLRGQDPLFDNEQYEFHTGTAQALTPSMVRTFTQNVPRSALDEDSDFLLARRDEIYARVMLTPFMPTPAQGDSNVVEGQFGSRGSD